MQVVPEKMVRAQLAEQTGADMPPHKSFIREQVRSLSCVATRFQAQTSGLNLQA